MAENKRIFNGTTGLVNKVDPARAKLDLDSGMADLTVALNVDISDSFRPRRRKGITKQSSTPGHSIFCDGGHCLFVTGSNLARLNPDFSHTVLQAVSAPHKRMRYVQVGEEIYFGNGTHKGVYSQETGTASAWEASDPPQASDVEYTGPLPPSHLEHFKGRLYLAVGSFVLYSLEWSYSLYDPMFNIIPFQDRITLLRRTEGGMYVGTTEGVFFLKGYGPSEFTVSKVSGLAPVEHTDVRVEASDIVDDAQGDAVLWLSTEGVCFGGPQGSFDCLTKDRVALPPALNGCAVAYRGAYLGICNV